MEKLKLAAGMTGEQKRYAVEAALLLGFQTETATFPVITADGEIPVPENMEELKALWKKSTGEVPEEYESASKHTGPIFDLDFRKAKRAGDDASERGFPERRESGSSSGCVGCEDCTSGGCR